MKREPNRVTFDELALRYILMFFLNVLLNRNIHQRSELTNGIPHMRRIFQISGWLLASAITVLSLVPPQYRLVTAAAHNLEHLAIFLSVGIAFGAGYPDRPWAVAIGLASFSGAIEIAQLWVPGRHARLIDFLVDTTAALIGACLIRVVVRLGGIGKKCSWLS